MTYPQEPGQQPDPTPPEWQTTEFPAIPRYPAYPGDPTAPQQPGPQDGGQDYPQYDPQYGPQYDPQYGPQYGGPYGQYAQPGPGGYPASDPQYGGGYPPVGPPQGPSGGPHGRRNALIAAVAVVVAVGAGTGIYFAVSGSDSTTASKPAPSTVSGSPAPSGAASTDASGKLIAPTSFDGYTELNNAAAQAAKTVIAESGGSGASGALINASTVTVYGRTGTQAPTLIVLALPAAAVPGGLSGELFTRSFLTIASATPTTVDAGTHGGSAMCASASAELLCSWSDPATAGGIVSVDPSLTDSDVAKIQNQFRDAVS